jgi:hypothetical protein
MTPSYKWWVVQNALLHVFAKLAISNNNILCYKQVYHNAFMRSCDASKPTMFNLVREEKNGEHGDCYRINEKSKGMSARDNLKLWLHDFFEAIYDVMHMCENNNGST